MPADFEGTLLLYKAKNGDRRADLSAQMWMQQQVNIVNHCCAVAVLVVAVVLVGCSHKIGSLDVVGTYVANRGKGVDVLEVKRDGTYLYTCNPGKAPDFSNTGHWKSSSSDVSSFTNENTWSLHYDDGEPRMTFDDFRFCALDYRKPAGYWDVSVQRSWRGRIQLPVDRDVNFYFVKRDR